MGKWYTPCEERFMKPFVYLCDIVPDTILDFWEFIFWMVVTAFVILLCCFAVSFVVGFVKGFCGRMKNLLT